MPGITLTITDDKGSTRDVRLTGSRITIGRSIDNDITLDDPALSRRHCLLEFDGDTAYISDCGSQNGTYLSGRRVTGAERLESGNTVSLGSCDLRITLGQPGPAVQSSPGEFVFHPPPAARGNGLDRLFSAPVVAFIAIALIVVTAAIVVIVTRDQTNAFEEKGRASSDSRPIDGGLGGGGSNSNSAPGDSGVGAAGRVPNPEEIETAAGIVIRRISSDDRSYVFPSGAIDDLAARVEEHRRSPALPDALRALNRQAAGIALAARREALEPGLVIYAALAETRGGAEGDPVAAARRLLGSLGSLRPHFGCELADCALIMVAAYKLDPGTRRSHPLLATMRRLVRNPLTERNVWHLHERGGLDGETYRFVLDLIAYGAIAQNPGQFGVPGNAITF
jgi:hypothetical protein